MSKEIVNIYGVSLCDLNNNVWNSHFLYSSLTAEKLFKWSLQRLLYTLKSQQMNWKLSLWFKDHFKTVFETIHDSFDLILETFWNSRDIHEISRNFYTPQNSLFGRVLCFKKLIFVLAMFLKSFPTNSLGHKQPERYSQHVNTTKSAFCSDISKSWFWPNLHHILIVARIKKILFYVKKKF